MNVIDQLIKGLRNDSTIEMMWETRVKFSHLYNSEEIYWAQRSRIHWLKEGDRNTRLFHVRTSYQYWKNRIDDLRNGPREWISDTRGLCDVSREYFDALFTSECDGAFEEVINKISRCVTLEMNVTLDSPVLDRDCGCFWADGP